jgi:hypothetical protein
VIISDVNSNNQNEIKMEPLRTPVEKFGVTILKDDSMPALQKQIDLFTNDEGKDTINRIIVKTNLNNYYDEDKKCMVYCAAILYKFLSPQELFTMFSQFGSRP